MNDYILTIIIPVYNEEDNLERVEKEMKEHLETSRFRSKVLFVNDGSSDSSLALIEEVCGRNEAFSFVSLQKNMGLSAAIKAGIDQVETPFLGYIDSDLQTDPRDFDLLMEHAEEFDIVTGIRANRKDSLVKNMSSQIANSIRRSVTNDGVEDTGCPLKVLKTGIAQKIPFFKGMHRFIPALVLLQEGKVKQVPVRHYPRIAGEAKYHLWNRLLGPLCDTLVFGWMKTRYINYVIDRKG